MPSQDKGKREMEGDKELMTTAGPTTYPDVNALLARLLDGARSILGDDLVGFYLHGSLAIGGFNPEVSDVDFLVATAGLLPEETVAELSAMHQELAAADSSWATELEGSYIPRAALRRYNPARARHPQLEHGSSTLGVEQHDSDWVINRYILREHGVVVTGPEPETLIDPIGPNELRHAVRNLLWWWELQLEDTTRLETSRYQAYAVLTMCRVLYTLEHGDVAPKPEAARWAQGATSRPWPALIQRALAWRPDKPLDRLGDTLGFIRYTLTRARARE